MVLPHLWAGPRAALRTLKLEEVRALSSASVTS
jgi:hypothetical protein